MKYSNEDKLDALLSYEKLLAAGEFNEVTADAPSPKNQQICTDYSEEAIPERDPAYQLSDGTLYETQTVEHMPAAERLALAHCLEQLGMSRARAAVVASL